MSGCPPLKDRVWVGAGAHHLTLTWRWEKLGCSRCVIAVVTPQLIFAREKVDHALSPIRKGMLHKVLLLNLLLAHRLPTPL